MMEAANLSAWIGWGVVCFCFGGCVGMTLGGIIGVNFAWRKFVREFYFIDRQAMTLDQFTSKLAQLAEAERAAKDRARANG